MTERIKKIISIVFEIDESQITNFSSPENVENWDSLGHLNLIVALEEEFELKFTDDEISEMLNFSLIEEILKEKRISE
jgi:acyl carrier protein